MVRSSLLSVLLAFVALPLFGQPAAGYRFAPGDTLRYDERTNGLVVMEAPQGRREIRSEHDATVAIAFVGGDTARAWYERLRVSSAAPGTPLQEPATDALLRQPFVLGISPYGQTNLRSAPPLPAAIAGITDLTHQFDDFLIALPSEPLRLGLAWADTVRITHSGRPTDTQRAVHERSYRVTRDTVVDGTPAFVIEVLQRIEVQASSPMPQPGLVAETALEGSETGFAVVAAAGGRLLLRSRTGHLTGQLSVTGGPRAMSLPQTHSYTSTLRLVR